MKTTVSRATLHNEDYINEKDLAESLNDKYTFLGARSYRIKMRNIDKLK